MKAAPKKCPKCLSELSLEPIADVYIHRCVKCHGMWFDGNDLKRLLSIPGTELIDDGPVAETRHLDRKKGDLICPRCKGLLIKMVHPKHKHIYFESCQVCWGTWLDGGEFASLKKDSLIDFLKDLFTPARDSNN